MFPFEIYPIETLGKKENKQGKQVNNITAGYFVKFDLEACLAAHINTTELKRSMKASAMVEKMDKEPEVTAATS